MTTVFGGAYFLGAGGIEPRLSGGTPLRAKAALCPAGRDLAVYTSGASWLVAENGKLAFDAGGCAAICGRPAFSAVGMGGVADILRSPKSVPGLRGSLSGHYALALTCDSGRTLILSADPTGWQRLFYLQHEGMLYFSASIGPLIGTMPGKPRLSSAAGAEFLLNGALLSGDMTLIDGIRELPPGHMLLLGPGGAEERICCDLFGGLNDNAADPPQKFRQAMLDCTAAAIGNDGHAAVSLSGGIDSAVIAACAADVLGPKNVTAFTYEFEDPTHISEAGEAAVLCRALGIEHRTVKISYDEYLDTLPETAWLMEAPAALIMRTRMLVVSKRVKKEGFSTLLTGHGIEQLLGMTVNSWYINSLGARIGTARFPEKIMGPLWRSAFFPEGTFLNAAGRKLCKMYSGLWPPPIMAYYQLVCALQRCGVIGAGDGFYPRELLPLVKPAAGMFLSSSMFKMAEKQPLTARLQYLNYSMIRARIMRGMCLTASVGCAQVSPAMFLHPAGMAHYLRGGAERGRGFLNQAMKGRLPEASLSRRKFCLQQAMISYDWVSRIAGVLASASLASSEEVSGSCFGGYKGYGRVFDRGLADYDHHGDTLPFSGRNLVYLAFWDMVNKGRSPGGEPPAWNAGRTGINAAVPVK
jgi:hypothetical protein